MSGGARPQQPQRAGGRVALHHHHGMPVRASRATRCAGRACSPGREDMYTRPAAPAAIARRSMCRRLVVFPEETVEVAQLLGLDQHEGALGLRAPSAAKSASAPRPASTSGAVSPARGRAGRERQRGDPRGEASPLAPHRRRAPSARATGPASETAPSGPSTPASLNRSSAQSTARWLAGEPVGRPPIAVGERLQIAGQRRVPEQGRDQAAGVVGLGGSEAGRRARSARRAGVASACPDETSPERSEAICR